MLSPFTRPVARLRRRICFATLLLAPLVAPFRDIAAQVLGDVVDAGAAFRESNQLLFAASRLTAFDAASGRGTLQWDRYAIQPSFNFSKIDLGWSRAPSSEFPGTEYDRDPALPFQISFASPRTLRLRFNTRNLPAAGSDAPESLMLAGPVPRDDSWRVTDGDSVVTYASAYGQVRITKNPWSIELLNAKGERLTRTQRLGEPKSFSPYIPFSFLRRARDAGQSTAATFELAPDERIYGFGESFTRLNKRGQRVVAFIRDGMGAQSQRQYKAVPFFVSSRGYAMFVHTSAPVTFDVGAEFDAHHTIYSGDDFLDLFVFLGEPKALLSEYTALTGRSPVPPLWSFGLWMSRITYKSEAEVRDVAAKLRQYRIPADVLHLDTGWFETDWRSDYQFSKSRFTDPAAMIRDLGKDGFHISLWQYTYFTPKNALSRELASQGLTVKDAKGEQASEDAVLDFSNPDALAWYRAKLTPLLKLGVGAIKVDFGENAPTDGIYHSGRTGWYEHNLYPLRYNKAVFDLTKEVNGEGVIWARSAWAGSQRYPLHWGGDAENTNSAMAASLRAGLSFGLSGFTYWSHDAGGFVDRAPRDLYRRWLAFGVLTSHTRTHGAPPREPWEYDSAMVVDFRRAVELKYRLMPYIYAQAKLSSANGWPMLRTLFFEHPDDPTSWMVEDEYMFGSQLLVAPLFEESPSRRVYLPPGTWIDYQSRQPYEGGRWYDMKAGAIPIILLVKNHSAIPHLAVAQSTAAMQWNDIEIQTFNVGGGEATGSVTLPDGDVQPLVVRSGRLAKDPYAGRVRWRISSR